MRICKKCGYATFTFDQSYFHGKLCIGIDKWERNNYKDSVSTDYSNNIRDKLSSW